MDLIYDKLDKLFDQLWPICRSISGPGIAQSLEIIKKHIPLEVVKIPTGETVLDWIVPPEWELISATLHTEDGVLVLTADDSNIHVLNFSEPFTGIISYEELCDHLYSDPAYPDAIPYVTSYYTRRWGLCISDSKKKTLRKDIKYKVEINTKIYDGFLRYGEYLLEGETDQTILIATYLCHPSLANNELSGPLASVGLYNKLFSMKKRHYSYRFLFWPETIGSVSFLAKTSKNELEKIAAGIVLTCLGGPSKKISFKNSRRDWVGQSTEIDELVKSFCKNDGNYFANREFSPTGGSDERQLCSPGANLPVIQAARTIYGEYPQYHTSLDTKDFMKVGSVIDSVNGIYLFIRALELNRTKLKSTILAGEPMLGKRNLYPTVNGPQTRSMSSDRVVDVREQLNLLLQVISLMDGSRNLIEIANFLGVSYDALIPTVESLINEGLIQL
jgi:aminopeptidase-like protein